MEHATTLYAGLNEKPAQSQFPVGLIVGVLFGLFAAMSFVGFGSAERLLFPVVSLGVAFWLLIKGRREDYVALTLWLFMLTPWLRRMVDLHAGFAQVNLLMLAPYTAGVLSAGLVVKGLKSRPFAYSSLFAIVFACIVYGLVVATVNSRFFSAAFDSIRWAVPPCLGLFIALDPERHLGYQAAVTKTMVLALIGTGAYGIYQYVTAPPWDVMWMREAALVSIGLPEPYLIRVFSTMNSPASFAAFLMAGLLWVVPSTGAARFPAIALGLVALLLTLLRTSWLGLVVGFLFLVLFGASARARLSIVIGLVCLPLVLLGVAQLPQGADIIGSRLDTLSSVQNDGSFLDRAAEYNDFFYKDLPEAPFGIGLGANGSYQSYVDSRSAKFVDGALMEIGTALGAFGGGFYFMAILTTAAIACWNSFRRQNTFVSSCAAIVTALTLSLIGGTITVGEVGVLFWMSAGFCMTARPATLVQPRRHVLLSNRA